MLASRRNARGASDPLRLTCGCGDKGVVVLFYKYVKIDAPASVVARIVEYNDTTAQGAVTGKIRVAPEGINATAAANDAQTMRAFTDFLESIDALGLRERGGGVEFWKPEPGCAHAFSTLSVRVVEELCPFGERELSTSETCGGDVQSVSPRAWHEALTTRREEEMSVIDARNFYESRVGAFRGSVLAPIRRFSQLKEWLARDGVVDAHVAGKDVYIYCTGGVRCEKVATYLATRLDEKSRPKSVRKLRGGIVAYAKEFDAKESLFKGSNYVFDARGSVPVGPENELPETSWCDGCRAPSGRLSKCVGVKCHVVLIACETCGDTVYCCDSCREQTVKSQGAEKFKRRPCECDCFESRERRCAAPDVGARGATLGGARKRPADA